jgi:hypothetical protein
LERTFEILVEKQDGHFEFSFNLDAISALEDHGNA